MRGWSHELRKKVHRERAVRMVREQRDQYDSEWATIVSIAEKFGCKAETLRLWVRRDERDSGQRPGPTTEQSEELKRLNTREL